MQQAWHVKRFFHQLLVEDPQPALCTGQEELKVDSMFLNQCLSKPAFNFNDFCMTFVFVPSKQLFQMLLPASVTSV